VEAHRPGAGRAGATELILVVDDDPGIRQTIRWALEDEGFTVATAADGQEALAQAERHRPALVILDMTLPVLDGHAVAAGLRAGGAAVPILMITADGSAVAKARRIGAYTYLKKPFEIEALLAAVRRGLPP
jgi:two-component system OmpR family response regulator